MGRAATERFSSRSAQLACLAGEYAIVELGQHTTREELNVILERFPKSSDVEGRADPAQFVQQKERGASYATSEYTNYHPA